MDLETRALLRYASKLTETPSFVTEEDTAALKECGWNDRAIWERAIAFGHYSRSTREGVITDPELAKYKGMPLGGFKLRLNQMASAMGRVQLKYYEERCAEVRRAMNHFWDQLKGAPGIKAHRPPADSGSTMGGWYNARGLYRGVEDIYRSG